MYILRTYTRCVFEVHKDARRTRLSIQVTFNRVATARRSPAKTFHSPPRRSGPIVRSTNWVSLIACARAGLTTRGRRRKLLRSLRFRAAKIRARSRSQPLARSSRLAAPSESVSTAASSRDFCAVSRRAPKTSTDTEHRAHAPRRPHRQHQEALYGGARLPLALEFVSRLLDPLRFVISLKIIQ